MLNEGIPRREREKLRHRQKILDAALGLFSEAGFHNVSMQQIATRAEFALGTLYNFFESKEILYQTLIREVADRFHRALTEAVESGEDEVENLRNYVRAKADVFRDNLAIVRLYHRETSGASFNIKAGFDADVMEQYGQLMVQLTKVFEDGMKKKRFNKIADPYYLAIAIDSLTNAVLIGCLEDPESRSYPQDPDVLLNIFFKGLLVS